MNKLMDRIARIIRVVTGIEAHREYVAYKTRCLAIELSLAARPWYSYNPWPI